MFWMIYFIIGIIYVLYNGFIRKLYEKGDGDWLLPMTHLGLWPLFLLGAVVNGIAKRYDNKNRSEEYKERA